MSDIGFSPDDFEGDIVVKFEDKRVNYEKHEDYRVEGDSECSQ
jgi:hypothetical protein